MGLVEGSSWCRMDSSKEANVDSPKRLMFTNFELKI